jgi:PAS domain S-box-containing protein
MIAICTYSLGQCGASEVIDVVSNHQFALIRREGEWVIIESSERKRAEEELRERELFNFALFEYNPIQTVAVDTEGKVTGFNRAKKRSGDRLPNIGDVMYKDYAGKHENDMYGELMKCIRLGEIKEFPEQKYGEKVLSITISPFAKGAVTISQDITELVRAEDEIKSLAKFPSENSNPVLRLGQDGVILYANEASKALLRDWGCVVGSYAPLFWRDLVTEALTNRLTKTVDMRYGEQVCSFFVAPITDAGYVNFYGRDITKHRQVEQALRDSEMKYKNLFEQANEAIFLADIETGYILDANREAERLLGRSRKEIVNRHQSELHSPDKADFYKEHFRRHIEAGHIVDLDAEVIRKDGTIVPVCISASVIELAGGKLMQGIFTDITERKKVEEEREKLIHELQDALGKIKTLSGLLPICASCKKIRDDKGYWNQIEAYIGDHSEAEFTHSICPECMKKLYPDFADNKNKEVIKEKIK